MLGKTKAKQIDVYRTFGEWEFISNRIKEMGGKDIRTHVRYQVIRMANKFENCENCITEAEGEKVRKTFYFDEYCMRAILLISLKMKKPMAAVLDDLIINPLLNKNERT